MGSLPGTIFEAVKVPDEIFGTVSARLIAAATGLSAGCRTLALSKGAGFDFSLLEWASSGSRPVSPSTNRLAISNTRVSFHPEW